jgi:hypothetical protein
VLGAWCLVLGGVKRGIRSERCSLAGSGVFDGAGLEQAASDVGRGMSCRGRSTPELMMGGDGGSRQSRSGCRKALRVQRLQMQRWAR